MLQPYGSLSVADYLSKISIFQLKKQGALRRYYSIVGGFDFYLVENLKEYLLGDEFPKEGYLRLKYKYEERDFDYKAYLTTTNCNYGGYRYWFVCPLCDRRIGVLYFKSGIYACHKSQQLTYESRNIGGYQKQYGRIISLPELEEIQKDVKRKFYNGKIT